MFCFMKLVWREALNQTFKLPHQKKNIRKWNHKWINMKYFCGELLFWLLAPLMFSIYCVILFLKSTNNSSRHSGAILKQFSYSSFSYKQTWERKIYTYIVRIPPSASFSSLKMGEVNFNYLPRRGRGLWKFSKREWKYGAGADLIKSRGEGLALFLFNFFKVYHFYI